MGWIIGIIICVVILVAFMNAPKETMGCLGFIVLLVAVLVYFTIIAPDQRIKNINSKIVINVQYDTKYCSQDYPLAIYIENKSSETLKRVSWNIDAFRPGYSTNLTGYDNDYYSDKILKPGDKWSSCYRLPPTLKNNETNTGSLKYEISEKYGSFE